MAGYMDGGCTDGRMGRMAGYMDAGWTNGQVVRRTEGWAAGCFVSVAFREGEPFSTSIIAEGAVGCGQCSLGGLERYRFE